MWNWTQEYILKLWLQHILLPLPQMCYVYKQKQSHHLILIIYLTTYAFKISLLYLNSQIILFSHPLALLYKLLKALLYNNFNFLLFLLLFLSFFQRYHSHLQLLFTYLSNSLNLLNDQSIPSSKGTHFLRLRSFLDWSP